MSDTGDQDRPATRWEPLKARARGSRKWLLGLGFLVGQGELDFWEVAEFATLGVMVGDQIGYLLGRWGGQRLVDRSRTWVDDERLGRAEAFTSRWGGVGVFSTRWLLTPLGPSVNLMSGIAEYPWRYFVVCDVIGEAV